jgi:hypothetical protein
VSTRMAAAHGLVRAPARSRVRAPSSATLRLELLLLNTIPQGSSPAGLVFLCTLPHVPRGDGVDAMTPYNFMDEARCCVWALMPARARSYRSARRSSPLAAASPPCT